MRAIALIAASLALFSACGGGESDSDRSIREALANMDALDSYRMEIQYSAEQAATSGDRVDFDGGVLMVSSPPALGQADSRLEVIEADGYSYTRICMSTCDRWERSREPTFAELELSSSPYTFALTAARLVPDWEVLTDNGATLHVRGHTSMENALNANMRLTAENAGYRDNEIDNAFEQIGHLEANPPVTVELWIDTAELLITRIRSDDDNKTEHGGYYLDVTYSLFNGVSIEIPTDFIEAPS